MERIKENEPSKEASNSLGTKKRRMTTQQASGVGDYEGK